MARRSWPIAANPVSGALTWDGGLSTTLLPVSVNHQTNVVTWTGGAQSDRWPQSVSLAGSLTYLATATISDDFNRADTAAGLGNATTGQAWTSTGLRILSNQVAPIAALTSSDVTGATIDAGKADVDITVTLAVTQTGVAVLWRMNAGATQGYGWNPGAGIAYTWSTGAFANGSITNKVTGMTTGTSGALCRVVASGSTHTMYLNGAQVGTFSDATYSSNTVVGLRYQGTTNAGRYDDFQVI